MTAPEDLRRHIDVAARWVLWQSLEAWLEEGHARLPEIHAEDFERIAAEAERLLPADVTLDEYREALAVLEARAEGTAV